MIIQNGIKIIDGEKIVYIKSSHTHDFVSYTFLDGKNIFLDGGNFYLRRGGDLELFKDKSKIINYNLDENSSLKNILDMLFWGCRGKSGKESIHYLPIKDLELAHLKAILDYKKQLKNTLEDFEMSPLHIFVINYWIGEKTEEAREQADKDFLKKNK